MAVFPQLVIASNNKKKRAEIEAMLMDLGIVCVSAENTVFVDVEEDGSSFAENAEKKANAFMLANQLPALADDSGLNVLALDGAPGVFSARFAGDLATDAENNALLVKKMTSKTDRLAYFSCALHLALTNGIIYRAEGRVEGFIVEHADGVQGFGYDPLFFSPELGKTFAHASLEEKASVSHRGRALRALKAKLSES